MQHNSKYRLCSKRAETINHIISETSKLAQKEYKTRHDWVGKVIHLELSKKFKFDHTNKWYLHNPAAVPENETHKIQWDFKIQTDHLISARWPNLIIINNNKKRELAELWTLLPRLIRVKLKESEKRDKYYDLGRELKRLWNVKLTFIPIVIGALGTVTERLLKGLEDLKIRGRVETIQNTTLLRSARILRRVLENWDLL